MEDKTGINFGGIFNVDSGRAEDFQRSENYTGTKFEAALSSWTSRLRQLLNPTITTKLETHVKTDYVKIAGIGILLLIIYKLLFRK